MTSKFWQITDTKIKIVVRHSHCGRLRDYTGYVVYTVSNDINTVGHFVFSLRPKSWVSDFGLRLKFKTLVSAKDKVTQWPWDTRGSLMLFEPFELLYHRKYRNCTALTCHICCLQWRRQELCGLSVQISVNCYCLWLLEQNKINERMNLAWRGAQSNMEITWHEIGLHTHPISKSWNLFHFDL